MEQYKKENLIRELKIGKLAVIQSAEAPISKNCIWLKDGVMYVFGNSGWESIGGGNVKDSFILAPIPLESYPVTLTKYVNEHNQTTYRVSDIGVAEVLVDSEDEKNSRPAIVMTMTDNTPFIYYIGRYGFIFDPESSIWEGELTIYREYPYDSGDSEFSSRGVNNPQAQYYSQLEESKNLLVVHPSFSTESQYSMDTIASIQLVMNPEVPGDIVDPA